MVVALQHTIALPPGFAQGGNDTVEGHIQHHQCVGHQHQGGFQHFRYHFLRAGADQGIQMGVVPGAHQHADIGVELSCGVQDTLCQPRIVKGNHQETSMLNARIHQDFLAAGITKQDVFAGGTGFL